MNHESTQTTLLRTSPEAHPSAEDQTSDATDSNHKRISSLITLAIAVAFVHLGALLWIGLSIRDFIYGPLVNAPFIPECQNLLIFGEELVLPLVREPAADLMQLQFVNLNTGKTRFSKPTTVVWFKGLISDGKRIWSFGNTGEVYETDGITSRTFQTNYKPSVKPAMNSGAFLFEGRPAIVDRVSDNLHRLLVLENEDWVERAQVAYPGRRRRWIADATGRSRLAPEFMVDIPAKEFRFGFTRTVVSNDDVHQFQIEALDRNQKNGSFRYDIAYRRGFDFTHISNSMPDSPRSALVPENAPPDSTGWELLGPQITHFVNDFVVHNGDLFLADWDNVSKVYRIIANESFADPKVTEEFVLKEPVSNSQQRMTVGLIQSTDQQRLFAICQPRLGESSLFEWNGHEFSPLPIKIDGVLTRPFRSIGMYFVELVAVLWFGTLLFSIGSEWLLTHTGESSYSFATETLPLASILLRCAARCVDLILIFAPIMVQAGLMMFQTNSQTIMETINQGKFSLLPQFLLDNFARTGGWSLVAGCSFVLLSAKYGITPGKYLCGIRVIRTTLQPCGIARSLARELLFYLEVPILLTAVPALSFCLGTACRQRLGDLVADTIVVAAKERNSC